MAVVDRIFTLEEVLSSRGKEQPPAVSPPVSASDIRKFAMAVYWPETPPRLFWDEPYARTTKWGGIVAPHEFNPFAWPICGPSFFPANLGKIPGGRRFYAGAEVEYGERMRPGDVITAFEHVSGVSERRGRSGRLIFVLSEIVWRNQAERVVKRKLATLVHIPPAEQRS